tara:strand:- start:8507 stop:9037 length:531 start_codon:yes stop_codon:yes gene_type:complete
MIYHSNLMTPQENFKQICDLTTSVVGLPQGSLAKKSRKIELQIPRMVACVICKLEERTRDSIMAKVLNRDRVTVWYYMQQHKNNYGGWEEYRNTFNRVYKAYIDLYDNKKEFIDEHHLKEHLIRNGVKENDKNEVGILVKSGKVETIIKTSYFDFSNQLERIKFVLQEYKFQIHIK